MGQRVSRTVSMMKCLTGFLRWRKRRELSFRIPLRRKLVQRLYQNLKKCSMNILHCLLIRQKILLNLSNGWTEKRLFCHGRWTVLQLSLPMMMANWLMQSPEEMGKLVSGSCIMSLILTVFQWGSRKKDMLLSAARQSCTIQSLSALTKTVRKMKMITKIREILQAVP